jgi:hypothetical protein
MEIPDLLGVFLSATGASVLTAHWLAKRLVDHRLKRDIEVLKADFAKEKVTWEGRVKTEVETVLGNRASDRQYEFEARKRLYTAIGPLRFQLLTACRDLEGRVKAIGLRDTYSTDLQHYYGRSTLYRMLQPLVLAVLVERQMAYADFSVDVAALYVLHFRRNGFAAFSGGNLVEGRGDHNWNRQEQHIFNDRLAIVINALVINDNTGSQRCARPHEFEEITQKADAKEVLAPFPRIMADFTPQSKPLFWLRLVAYGYLCNAYINKCGLDVGFERRDFPLEQLLRRSDDPQILAALPEYLGRCKSLLSSTL